MNLLRRFHYLFREDFLEEIFLGVTARLNRLNRKYTSTFNAPSYSYRTKIGPNNKQYLQGYSKP